MRRTKNLGLPIYDNPSVDLFKISDFNDTHEKIDKQYEEIQEHIKHEIDSVDLSAYYTKGQTDSKIAEEIAKAQLGGEGGEVDLSAYATKQDVSNAINSITTFPTGDLVLRDVVEGEIFESGATSETPSTPTVTYGQIVLSKTSSTIAEGGTDTFTVKLDKAPTNNQIVYLSNDNSDVTLSASSLTFTPSNYSTPQTITITVTEDNTDYSDETCVITCTSPNVTSKTLTINITDNDEEPPVQVLEINNLLEKSDTFETSTVGGLKWQKYLVDVEIIEPGHCKVTGNTEGKTGLFKYQISSPDGIQSIPNNESHIFFSKYEKSTDGISYSYEGTSVLHYGSIKGSLSLVQETGIAKGQSVWIKNAILIDLTEAYGSGNEPSKEECMSKYWGVWNA